MKKIQFVLFLAFLMVSATAFTPGKKGNVEVLYFKANLACCKARACNALESKVKAVVEKNYPDGSVTFRQVKLSDTLNQELINRYNAQSQTLVIVKTSKKKVTSADVSDILRDFVASNDTSKFEKELTGKINELLD